MFPHVIFFFIEKEILERLEGKYNRVKDKIRYPPSVCGHVRVSVKDKISSKCVCVRLRACVCAGVCVNDKIRYPPSVCVCVCATSKASESLSISEMETSLNIIISKLIFTDSIQENIFCSCRY